MIRCAVIGKDIQVCKMAGYMMDGRGSVISKGTDFFLRYQVQNVFGFHTHYPVGNENSLAGVK
jgi:hypothetical protein